MCMSWPSTQNDARYSSRTPRMPLRAASKFERMAMARSLLENLCTPSKFGYDSTVCDTIDDSVFSEHYSSTALDSLDSGQTALVASSARVIMA